MVVIVDLDDDTASADAIKQLHHLVASPNTVTSDEVKQHEAEDRPNPNINGFSAALSCYPIVRQLASELDLNSLHDLSRTCRQFRVNLLQYRDQLIKHTLHCENEDVHTGRRLAQGLKHSQQAWTEARMAPGRALTSGKVGKCARDMVGECKKCGKVVCRNCTIKPPPNPVLRARHRRLCRTCTKGPLALTLPSRPQPSSRSDTPSPPSSKQLSALLDYEQLSPAFTASAFQRTPCSCDHAVWICQSCGHNLRSEDTMYTRAWSWRTRYSHYLGGVGTGAGEGNEGVQCGRGAFCLAAKIVEQEVDCGPDFLARQIQMTDPAAIGSGAGHSRWEGGSYVAQEIEGIGGVVKMKVKKQMLVGHVVKVYEDEKEKSIQYLEREVQGKLRSWCAWCDRVVLGPGDVEEMHGKRPSSSGCSSDSSNATN